MNQGRPKRSDYMNWAKTRQRGRFTLAVSGIGPIALDELGASWSDLALEPPPGYGYPRLTEAIAARCGVGPDRVVTAAGTSGANHLAMATILEPGDDVLCEFPAYEPMVTLALHLGARVRFVSRRAERGFRIDADDFTRTMRPTTRLVLLSNLHNPSSVATDAATLRAIGAQADKVGAKVLVDEVYLDAAFERAPPSAAALGDAFVVTSSLTKVYGISGLRAGWIVASSELAGRMWRMKDLFGVNDAHPAERLALVALGKLEALGARARRILDANRALWNGFVESHREALDVELLPYGTTSFPRVLRGDGDELETLLRDRYETTVVPGRFFGCPDRIRIGLCGDPEGFAEGLGRMGEALTGLLDG